MKTGSPEKIPACVGVVAHPRRPETLPVAQHIRDWLVARGVRVDLYNQWDSQSLAHLSDTDMIIALGGDGAMLRAARNCAPHQVSVLGVNMGYLGFLPEISTPDHWEAHLVRVMEGDYWIERRMTLEATVYHEGKIIDSGLALNDVVITRSQAVGTVLLQTYIDNYWATTYHADALIIATATGSTGYALAVGGPILPPDLHNILVVPVAPHLSMDRAIVLSEGSTIQVIMSPERESDVQVLVDGASLCEMQPGDALSVQVGKHEGLFVRMQERNYFYRSLLDRMEPRVPTRATPEHLQIQINKN